MSDGARTRDTQDHNLVLYLLSYAHHRRRAEPGPRSIAVTADGNDRSYFACGAFPYRAAISLAVTESGPGCGTNSASR